MRLAVLAASPQSAEVADLLTVQLSANEKIHLFERDELDRIYHEQGISVENRDDLQLGRLLGADGVLVVDAADEPNQPSGVRSQRVKIRLIAVKPGAVLAAEQFSVRDPAEWSSTFSRRLDSFLPKLAVPGKDVIPISLVNLRSAIPSAEGYAAEQQLKVLAIERLSQEPRLFVLERQKLIAMMAEKSLNADESAFWDGSYLLEGVVDQNGYSKDTITIDARLTPSRGRSANVFQVSGSRTNLADVINQLSGKIAAALKLNAPASAWNPADEAARYFAEAQWAQRWGAIAEAQAAADSAWALGKKDSECAQLRIQSYIAGLPEIVPPNVSVFSKWPGYHWAHVDDPPDPRDCDTAISALESFAEFIRNSPADEIQVLNDGHGSGWRNSDWYVLGINTLEAASQVLQHFCLNPQAQAAVADKLVNLRAAARTVAELLSRAPSVYDTYFVGDRVATYDELARTLDEQQNIFRCEVNWGAFWSDKPTDTLALYRKLISSPAYSYLHEDLWVRSPIQPRLVAWNPSDANGLPTVWAGFLDELSHSTNVLWQLEAKGFKFADAASVSELGTAFTNLFQGIFSNEEFFVASKVDLPYLAWHTGRLVRADGTGEMADAMNALMVTYEQYGPKFDEMERSYQSKTVPAAQTAAAFEKQREFLSSFARYDFMTFEHIFSAKDYSQAQAAMLLPLITAYTSNLLGQATNNRSRVQARAAAQWIQLVLQRPVEAILNPQRPAPNPGTPAHGPPPQSGSHPPPSFLPGKPPAVPKPVAAFTATITNALRVEKFIPIPVDGLPGGDISQLEIVAHHWQEGKLVLDLRYGAFKYEFDANGRYQSARGVTLSAIAIYDTAAEHWQVAGCPEADITKQTSFYDHTALLRGNLFTSDGGQILKYNFDGRTWKPLPISDGNDYELFAVNGRLYGADQFQIFEISDDGTKTRFLASSRRQPPVSKLDGETLGIPTLLPGPNQSLQVSTLDKIYRWTDHDWVEVCAKPHSIAALIFDAGVLFNDNNNVYGLTPETDQWECYLGGRIFKSPWINASQTVANDHYLWRIPPELPWLNSPMALQTTNLFVLVDHSKAQNVLDAQNVVIGQKILPQNGYHAALLCFTRDLPSPLKLFLQFDLDAGCAPLLGQREGFLPLLPYAASPWMIFSTNYLFMGLESPLLGPPPQAGIHAPCSAGIWLMPFTEIRSAVDFEKQLQLSRIAQSQTARAERHQHLLAKYDRNHNGVMDPDEKEEALDDPDFIEQNLDSIDINHNGTIDPKELAWFDANTNKVLDPKEQAGIEIAQHLLAQRLLEKFDANGDGVLDNSEFQALWQSWQVHVPPLPPWIPLASIQNQFGPGVQYVGEDELEAFIKRRLRSELRPPWRPGMPFGAMMRQRPNEPVNQRQVFKSLVEAYWQGAGSVHGIPGSIKNN